MADVTATSASLQSDDALTKDDNSARIFEVDITRLLSSSSSTLSNDTAVEIADRSRITDTTNSNSPFLKLPPEIRNRIYNLAVLQKGRIHLYPGWEMDRKIGNKPTMALLRTCRQVRNEASGIFYNLNTFAFDYLFQIQLFTRTLPTSHLESVRSISLKPGSVMTLINDFNAVHSLRVLPSLKEVRVRGHMDKINEDVLMTMPLRADGTSVEIIFDRV